MSITLICLRVKETEVYQIAILLNIFKFTTVFDEELFNLFSRFLILQCRNNTLTSISYVYMQAINLVLISEYNHVNLNINDLVMLNFTESFHFEIVVIVSKYVYTLIRYSENQSNKDLTGKSDCIIIVR